MARPRSNFICPKCGKQGYKENNPTRNGDYPNASTRKYLRVVHYDSATKKRHRHYIQNIVNDIALKEYNRAYQKVLEAMSPTEWVDHCLEMGKQEKEIRKWIRLRREKRTKENQRRLVKT